MRSDRSGPGPAPTTRRLSTSALGAHAPLVACWVIALTLTVASAIYTKETGALPPLVEVAQREAPRETNAIAPAPITIEPEPVVEETPDASPEVFPQGTRWFDGRPIRPVRVIVMRVTGYSPDARSCGKYADGQTATLHSVWTNGMRLVAADPKVLPYFSLVSVPGYHGADVVPVLDCGAAIKGAELDLLFPTHEMALRWGVRSVPVTVWAYADED